MASTIKSGSNNDLYIQTDGVDRIVVDSNGNTSVTGNVGIGTASPTAKLEIHDGNNKALIGDINSNSTMSLRMSDNIAQPVEVQAYSNSLKLRTTPNGGSITDRMIIDANGYVTMPYQPSFRAYLSASVAGGNVVLWTDTFHNTGSHFSTANGRFTAPVSGVYQINLHYLGDNVSTQCDVYIRVNGSPNAGARTRSATASGHETTSVSHAISLSAGDYVDVENSGASVFYGDTSLTWSEFSGHLIG